MMEDQEYLLNRILEIMEEEQPDGLLIAGDVYDKTIPPAEAVRLMDDFLTAVAAKHVPVFLISGNHDSAERVAFGHQLMQGAAFGSRRYTTEPSGTTPWRIGGAR